MNIFLSYDHDDFKKAEPLARAFEAQGWSVFWDSKISSGAEWRQKISDEISAADCVVVLWSKASLKSDWVNDEADMARRIGRILIHVIIQETVLPPLGLRGIQAADLSAWNGSEDYPRLQKLVGDIAGYLSTTVSESEKRKKEAIRIQNILAARQKFRNRNTIIWWTFGGAVGAASMLFALRAISGLTILNAELPGSVASVFAISAAVPGGAMGFGLAAADQLWKTASDRGIGKLSSSQIFRLRSILVVVLGTLSFAIAHIVWGFTNTHLEKWVEVVRESPVAFGAGLALSITLHDQPYAGLRMSFGSWLWRIQFAALAFALMQLPFSLKRVLTLDGTPTTGLSFIGSSDFYRDNFAYWNQIPAKLKSPAYFAIADSTLVGALLCVGITIGVVKAFVLLSQSLKSIDVPETQTEVNQ
jgi:hypothetical protein